MGVQHLKSTPSDYFWWRFKSGEDREGLEKVTRKVTPAEAAQKDADIKAVRGMQGLNMACRVYAVLACTPASTPLSQHCTDYQCLSVRLQTAHGVLEVMRRVMPCSGCLALWGSVIKAVCSA